MNFTTFFNVNLWQMKEDYTCQSQYFTHRINTLKFGQLFQIRNKPKLTKQCKFIRVLQYHANPPG
jgi:hypothetical protein